MIPDYLKVMPCLCAWLNYLDLCENAIYFLPRGPNSPSDAWKKWRMPKLKLNYGLSNKNNENLLVFIEIVGKQYNVKCAVSVRDIIVIVHVVQVWKVRLYASTEICRTHWKHSLGMYQFQRSLLLYVHVATVGSIIIFWRAF